MASTTAARKSTDADAFDKRTATQALRCLETVGIDESAVRLLAVYVARDVQHYTQAYAHGESIADALGVAYRCARGGGSELDRANLPLARHVCRQAVDAFWQTHDDAYQQGGRVECRPVLSAINAAAAACAACEIFTGRFGRARRGDIDNAVFAVAKAEQAERLRGLGPGFDDAVGRFRDLLAYVAGNPYRPVSVCRDGEARAMARQLEIDGDAVTLAALADKQEEYGCEEAAGVLRGRGYLAGCHVVRAILAG